MLRHDKPVASSSLARVPFNRFPSNPLVGFGEKKGGREREGKGGGGDWYTASLVLLILATAPVTHSKCILSRSVL